MEQGLLSRLQRYFSASFGGRYVEYVIKEVIEEQPHLATVLFGVKRPNYLKVEYRFEVAGLTRIADLAFLDPETDRPLCLIEIKYDDHRNPKNAAQLEHHLHFCRKQNCKFIMLSQHLLPAELRRRVPSGQALLFSDLADRLRGSESSIGALLRRLFVDRGLVMHKFGSRDLAHLKSFVFRLVNPWLGQGRSHTKDAMTGGAAEAFRNLLSNMNIIAKEVTANARDRSPTIDFELDPWVKRKHILTIANEKPKVLSISAYDAKDGGYLSVFGRTRLMDKSSSWLQVEFGIGLEANSGDRDFYSFTYAAVYSNAFSGENVYVLKYASTRVLYDKPRAVMAIKKRITEAIDDALRRAPPRSQVVMLRKFRGAMR